MTDQDTPQTVFDPTTVIRKGFCTVAESRTRPAEPHKLYYEIHGDATASESDVNRIVFIMGLNNSSSAWEAQVVYFSRLSNYQVLVFDNRGVGNSASPRGFYKTSEMALDCSELLQFIGWTSRVNVVGVSMGGMIALELAAANPERLASLMLTSTKSGDKLEIPSFAATNLFLRLLSGTVTTEQAISLITTTLYPAAYLNELADDGRTRREVTEAAFLRRYNMNRRQTLAGRVGQTFAVLGHRVSKQRLAAIAASFAPGKIAIITGSEDALIDPKRSEELHAALPGSSLEIVQGGGHALPGQITDKYNAWIVDVVTRV